MGRICKKLRGISMWRTCTPEKQAFPHPQTSVWVWPEAAHSNLITQTNNYTHTVLHYAKNNGVKVSAVSTLLEEHTRICRQHKELTTNSNPCAIYHKVQSDNRFVYSVVEIFVCETRSWVGAGSKHLDGLVCVSKSMLGVGQRTAFKQRPHLPSGSSW